jgi:DNA-binding CsgD family transcriptional regulator
MRGFLVTGALATRTRGGDDRVVAGRLTSSRLVGRERELEVLRAAVAAATAGEASSVLVAGEAGVGKSRLVGEIAQEAAEDGVVVLFGHCVEVGDAELPYAPIVGALRALAAQLEPEDLGEVLGPARGELARLVPDFGEVQAPPPEAAGFGQARLFELLLGTLVRLGRVAPVLLVVEDLHWADRSTRDLLRFLVRNASTERLVLVATYRSDDLHRAHPLRAVLAELEREGRVRRIALEPFTRDEFLDHVAAIVDELPDAATLDRLYERSEGNAFFTEELLAGSDGIGELPASLRDALLVRLERLTPPAQQLVRVAAAAGRRVDHRLLAAVAGLPEADLAAALREAVAAMVLVPTRERAYEFRHELLREAAYADVLPGEREALHVALARELEARPELAGGTPAAELAFHWHAAYELELALPASVRAGEEAERVYAYAEAQRHFERALEVWGRAPQAERALDRIAIVGRAAKAASWAGEHNRAIALVRRALDTIDAGEDPARAAELHTQLARYLFAAGRGEEARRIAQRGVELMPPEPTAERAVTLEAHARMLLLSGRRMDSVPNVDEAVEIARRVGAREVEAAALATRAIMLLLAGRWEETVATCREAIDIALEIGAVEQAIRAYINGSEALDQAGRVEEAMVFAREGVEATASLGVARTWGANLVGEIALRLIKLGRLDEATEAAQVVLRGSPSGLAGASLHQAIGAIAARRGDEAAMQDSLRLAGGNALDAGGGQWSTPSAAAAAELALWKSEPEAALKIVTDALAAIENAEWVFYSAPLYALGATAVAEKGGPREALLALRERFDSQLGEVPHPMPEALAFRSQLEAELRRLEGDGAAEAFGEARERWAALGFPFHAALCAWRRAEALLPERDQVGDLLAEAHGTAVELGARPLAEAIEGLARRARLALKSDEEPQAVSALERTGITPRELEVLALIAEGRTNREIGAALFISEKTASVHVSNILSKLGAANRGQAAAIAHQLGVVEPATPTAG